TAEIVGLAAEEIGGPREAQLLERARQLMASLPFPEIDVLVVRQIGKNISGTGMDTNIIGRLMIPRQPEHFGGPDVAVIAALDLADETHGNATGIGLANVTTARLAAKTDWVATYTNAITAGIFGMQRVSLPITMPDDRRALEIALRGCGQPPSPGGQEFLEGLRPSKPPTTYILPTEEQQRYHVKAIQPHPQRRQPCHCHRREHGRPASRPSAGRSLRAGDDRRARSLPAGP